MKENKNTFNILFSSNIINMVCTDIADNKKYYHGFSIHEKWLDEECINDIVNRLLSQ